jgi:hypothetical protein
VLPLLERLAGVYTEMLPFITDKQYLVVRPKSLDKIAHLPG